MLVLVPTLFVTSGVAVLVWLWAAATFFTGRWVYGMIPAGVRGDMQHFKTTGGKQVIFQKERRGDNHDDDDDEGPDGFGAVDVKSEAAEIKE